jgi:hypothetical protein
MRLHAVTAEELNARALQASDTDPNDALRRRCRRAPAEHARHARADRRPLGYGLADLEALARGSRNCCYCEAWLTASTLAFDHQTPTCRAADYRLGNLAVCCGPCNLANGLLTADEFRQLLTLLRTWRPPARAGVLARLRAGGRRYARRRG